jgi:hypothetical protein
VPTQRHAPAREYARLRVRLRLEGRTIAAELALYASSKERFHHNAAECEGVDNYPAISSRTSGTPLIA